MKSTYFVALVFSVAISRSFSCNSFSSKPAIAKRNFNLVLKNELKMYTAVGNKLYAGQSLNINSYLLSSNKNYVGIMQDDGKFAIYSKDGNVEYSTGGSQLSSARLHFQTDGHICLKNVTGGNVWCSDGNARSGMCDGRCILLLDDDGILSAYRGTIKPANLFWASRVRPARDEFLKVANRADSKEVCPILEFPASITFDLQLGKSPKNQYNQPKNWNWTTGVDGSSVTELRSLLKRSFNEMALRENVFVRYGRENPNYLSTFDLFMRAMEGLESSTSNDERSDPATPPQIVHYSRSNEVAVDSRNIAVASYVATVIEPGHWPSNRDTTDAPRTYTNELVALAGLQLRSNRNRYASFDAGHILGNQLGGTVEQWNLYPQNGHLNRGLWSTLESGVRRIAVRNSYSVVAEYSLEYDDFVAFIPTYVHFSFRFFNSQRQFVRSLTGMFPNLAPDGVRHVYRLLSVNPLYLNEQEQRVIIFRDSEEMDQPPDIETESVNEIFRRLFGDDCDLSPIRRRQ